MKALLQKAISWAGRALSEDNGNPSSLRVAVWYHDFLIGLSAFLIVLAAIVLFYIGKKDFVPVMMPLFMGIMGWFTVNRGSKQIQKMTENPNSTAPSNPAPQ